jgi:hypothetical protein
LDLLKKSPSSLMGFFSGGGAQGVQLEPFLQGSGAVGWGGFFERFCALKIILGSSQLIVGKSLPYSWKNQSNYYEITTTVACYYTFFWLICTDE